MRRLFIIRKDLNLSHGKLAAMVGHCCEAYWTNMLKKSISPWKKENELGQQLCYTCNLELPIDIVDEYVFGIFTKTICEAKNLNDLLKVKTYIDNINKIMLPEYSLKSSTEKIERQLQNNVFEVHDTLKLPLVEGVDYGWINDKCLTELVPENEDGTTTVGIWFRPLPDAIAHKISKKYKLYGAFDKKAKNKDKMTVSSVVCEMSWCEGEQQWTEARYTSYDDALKHLRCLFEKLTEDENYIDVIWRNEDKTSFSCTFALFKYDNVKTYEIESETIEVFDTFDENNV